VYKLTEFVDILSKIKKNDEKSQKSCAYACAFEKNVVILCRFCKKALMLMQKQLISD